MFQVLLIDDEPLVHHDLSMITDWSKGNYQLIGEAYNGAMALEMIERNPPHIAIIDVNMPGMNGVELNRTIRSRFPAIQTVMLSSYDDYDFVRECLNNGAIDYLLKHRLDEASLLAVLDKAALAIRQEDQNSGRRAEHAEMAGKMSAVTIREHIVDLARGNPEAAKNLSVYASGNGLYPEAVSFVAVIVQIIPFLLLTESYSDVQTNQMMQKAVDIIQQSLGDVRERTAAYVEDGRLAIVFSFKERSEHAAVSEASRQMIKIQHSLTMFLNLKCIYAVGHVCGSLLQLGASIGSAVRELDHIGANKEGALEARVTLSIEEQKQLLLAIERIDQDAVVRLIAAIFVKLRSQPIYSHPVQKIVSELLQIGDKAWKNSPMGLTAAAIADRLPSRADLGRIDKMDELQRWLNVYYASLLQQLKRQRVSGAHSRHVSQAIHLILENYQNSMTLEQAAGEIGLHPSYLSRIFKEETHATFSEYLNKVRIAAGCKLMESGRYSIKEISGQVGFTTYNYFFKVFKEMTGMTPHAYVNSLGRDPQS